MQPQRPMREAKRRIVWRALGSALIGLLCLAVLGRGEQSLREQAQRLAEAAIAEYKRGDQAGEASDDGMRAYERGIALADQAITLDPSVADGYYAKFLNLGRKSQHSSFASGALNVSRLKGLLRKTLELDPRHAQAWEAQGEMLLRLPRLLGGSDEEGERALRRAADLDPKWPRPLLRLAELDEANGNADRARSEARAALEAARSGGEENYRSEAEALLKRLGPGRR